MCSIINIFYTNITAHYPLSKDDIALSYQIILLFIAIKFLDKLMPQYLIINLRNEKKYFLHLLTLLILLSFGLVYPRSNSLTSKSLPGGTECKC